MSCGIILVDKPSGMTSHDVVAFIRKRFALKKVGHAGTLDPMATGLLIVLLGAFTKRSTHFSDFDKEYGAELCLGVATDTADKEGSVVSDRDIKPFGDRIKDINAIFASFYGRIEQVPPMYSAKKQSGKKLYELARKGVLVKREPKIVHIKEIKVTKVSLPHVTFKVKCSKGTYIRQLAHDIGERIGCGAHLTSLRRLGIGPFNVKNAVPFESLRNENRDFHENVLQPA